MNVMDFFPYPAPRNGQEECIKWLVDKINGGEKFLIVDARTGFGKSAVARTLTDYFSKFYSCDSFIFTSTKMLQDQYYNDSQLYNAYGVSYGVGKGRGNFKCKQISHPLERVDKDDEYVYDLNGNAFYDYTGWFDENSKVTCSDGVCTIMGDDFTCPYSALVHSEEYIHNSCNYLKMKYFTNKADVALLNYDVKVSDNVYTNGKNYHPRFLCIHDEAHNIENCILNYTTLTLPVSSLEEDINFNFLQEYWSYNHINQWLVILNGMVEEYRLTVKKLDNDIKSRFYTKEEKEVLLFKLKKLIARCQRIKRIYDYIIRDNGNWVVDLDEFNKKVEFKPLHVDKYTMDYLFESGIVHVFMSGSIISPKKFCEGLGIPYNKDNVYTSEGIFDFKEHNPIIKCMVGRMDNKHVDKTKYLTIPVLKKIFNKHKGDKGLIHCNSKKLADFIMESFKGTDFSNRLKCYGFLKSGVYPEKEKVINEFKSSNGDDIMVSYSLEEGVDLPYDECRFQVFYKAPYLFLGDVRVKRMRTLDSDWYMLGTIRRLQQMYGRGMRAVDDYCVNYALDSSLNDIFNHHLFPSYIREAVR